MSTEKLVRKFWELMASNDFDSVAAVLSTDFVLDWPQSRERIRGARHFAAVNREYPAHGRWQFQIERIVAGENDAVSEVAVSDGVVRARVISFFTIDDDRIRHVREFWPEPYAAQANRAQWVEPMPDIGV